MLQQVEDLSRDLEEMKSMVMRKKKTTLVAKLKKKFQNRPKIKIGIKKKNQEKVQKEPKGSQESNAKTSELVTSTTNIDKGSNEEDNPKEKNENIVFVELQKKQDDTEDIKTQQETGVVIEDSQQEEVDSGKHQPEVERKPIDNTESNENMAKEDTTQSNENTIEGHSENKQPKVDMEISQEIGVVIDYSQQQKLDLIQKNDVAGEVDSEKQQPEVERKPIEDSQQQESDLIQKNDVPEDMDTDNKQGE